MFIDIHTHTAEERYSGITRLNGSSYPSPEQLIAMLDTAGIEKAVILSSVSPEYRYTLVPSEETLRIANRYPDRLIPFCNIDPRFLTNSTEADFTHLLEAYKSLGCRGIGEYIPNIPLDDPLNMNFFHYVEESGLPLTFHLSAQQGGNYGCIDERGLPRLERVLKSFPNLIFLAHSQVFWSEIGDEIDETSRRGYPSGKVTPGRVVELMKKYPNLHGDLSAQSGFNAISRDPEFGYRFMEEFSERLYFGTDIASSSQQLPIVDYFNTMRKEKILSEETLDNISWKNAFTLLRLP